MHTDRHEGTDPIETLMQEHRLIERVLVALDEWAARVDGGDEAARAELGRFIEFIREFADGRHHAKEEGVLFEEMGRAGFPTDGGPIAVMLEEHELLRRLTAAMAAASSAWDPKATSAAREYTAILRQHIQKEDQILYPMARQVLGNRFAQVESRCAELDHGDPDRRRELERLGAELSQSPQPR